jgi:glutamate:GABA antiporter
MVMSNKTAVMKRLTAISIIMITVGSVDSIRNLPASAMLGSHLIFFYLLGALCFFIPSAFIAAELSSSAGQQAGVYDWVKRSFGPFLGLVAVWFQWTENLFWYPLVLSLIVKNVLLYFFPTLCHGHFTSQLVITFSIVFIFWVITFINVCGIRASAAFATFCTLFGLIVPFVFIIVMGALWYLTGEHSQLRLHWGNLIPSWHDSGWSALTVIMLSMMGIEIATVHSSNVDRPERAYPLALSVSSIVLLLTLIGGSLAIATVLPLGQYDPFTAITLFFDKVCVHFKLEFLEPFLMGAFIIGLIGSVNNWVISPTSGLRYAAKQGNLPPLFMKSNRQDAPVFMLLLQAVIVTFISLSLLGLSDAKTFFDMLSAIASQQYAFMYILMFLAAIKQRKMVVEKGFQIPGGFPVMVLLAGAGILSMIAVIGLGFVPPQAFSFWHKIGYESVMFGGMVVFFVAICLLYKASPSGGKR